MIEVNLHPGGSKGKGRKRRRAAAVSVPGAGRNPWQVALIVAVVAIPLAAAILWFTQRARANDLDERLTEVVADSARLSDLRALTDSLTDRQTQIAERMELIRRLDRNRYVWPHIMDELSRALPGFVWLTSVQEITPLPGLSIEIRGMAANPLAITEYVRRLEQSDYLGSVRLLGSQQELVPDSEIEVHAFTLLANFTPEPEPRPPPDQSRAGS